MHFSDRYPRLRRGYTLLEALMAASILLVIVTAVTSAVLAGQQNALEAHQRISAALAAEELMGRLMTVEYDTLPSWNGYREDVSTMTGLDGHPLPESFDGIGREVTVTLMIQEMTDLDVKIQGRQITVRAFNVTGRVLVELEHFIAEPAS